MLDGNLSLASNANIMLKSNTDQYEILKLIGEGSYGQVVKCLKESSHTYVAVKIIKNDPEEGRREASILTTLRDSFAGEFNIVRTLDIFNYRSYPCFAFEILEQNLSEFLTTQVLPAQQISHILQQLIMALWKLKQIGIIHADLKTNNIMIVDSTRLPYRVKIIDFGLAMKTSETHNWNYVGMRFYRAPEVLLGLPYEEEIDMWSLGCIAAEMFIKRPLYPGWHQFDQVRYICKTQDLLPKVMLDKSFQTPNFFKPIGRGWRLKSPLQYESETGHKCIDLKMHEPALNTLSDIEDVNIPSYLYGENLMIEKSIRSKIIDLIKKMLNLNPKRRITPAEALNHPAVRDLKLF